MKIALLGDIGIFGRFTQMSECEFNDYYHDYLSLAERCDFVVGNLEVPFSIEKKEFTAKSACLAASPADINKLNALKLTHVNLANNHTGDFGLEGYDLTIKLLEEYGLEYFGVAGKQSFIDHGGSKIALSGYCNMDSNPVYLYKHDALGEAGVNVANVAEIIENLAKNHESGYLNILAFHSGLEHVHLPGEMDIQFVRKLSKICPYIHYGHHPHVVQGYECIDKSHIFYSLGNFCFDDVYSNVSSKPLVKMSEQNKICLVPILTVNSNVVEHVEFNWFRLGDSSFELLTPESNEFIKKVQSSFIDPDFESIKEERAQILAEHNRTRVNNRDFSWYFDRLNFRYAKLFFNSKRNAKLYVENFVEHLKDRN